MGDLSFHFDATYQWDYAKEILASPNIRSALLMNASPDQVSYALQQCDFVVVRIFDPFNEYQGGANPDFEKQVIDNHNPVEFVAVLNAMGYDRFQGNNKLRFVVGWNELYSRRGQNEKSQNAKIIAIATAMINAGYGVGLGAWAAAKSFYQADVDNGVWDDLIRFSVQHKDMVSWDIHEYEVGRTVGQHLKSYPDGYPNSLLNPDAMKKENWGKIPYAGNVSNNYHMGRKAMMLVRSRFLTGDEFGHYTGECAHDYLDDGPLKAFLENDFIPQFGKPSGINTLQAYYTHLAGGQLTNDAYNAMLYDDVIWYAENDGGAIANFIFAHNGSNHWTKYNTGNENRRSFVTRIMNHGSETMSEKLQFNFSPDDFELYQVRTNTGGNVRVRANYGTDEQILSVFLTPEYQQVALVHPNRNITNYPPSANGYTWIHLVFSNGMAGWTAQELLDIQAVTNNAEYKAMVEAIRNIVCQ